MGARLNAYNTPLPTRVTMPNLVALWTSVWVAKSLGTLGPAPWDGRGWNTPFSHVCYNAKFGCSRSNGTKVLCHFSIHVISTHPVKKIVPAALIRLQPSNFACMFFCRHCITIWDRISASVHLLYLSRPPTILLQFAVATTIRRLMTYSWRVHFPSVVHWSLISR